MDGSGDLGTLQSRAEQFLQGWLHNCAPDEIPRKLAHLAVAPKDNPVKELFRAADRPPPLATTTSNDSRTSEPSQHRSKFSLRFSRNKDKGKAGLGGQHDCQGVFQADVKHPDENLQIVEQNLQRFGCISESFSKAKASHPYNCIFCRTNYTTKGTCKRHLEDIHVAKRYFRCVMCSEKFATAPEVRKHCHSCGAGIMGWNIETPEAHKVYSSEFVSHQVFSTLQFYVNHLLELSASPLEGRPIRSWHRKLRNLLEQPAYESTVCDISVRLFGTEDGWQNVRWEHERVRKTVMDIETGVLDCEPEGGGSSKTQHTQRFLEDLFSHRAIHTAVTSPGREASQAPAPKAEPETELDEKPADMQRLAEMTPKRPLSFESANAAPVRKPPGPQSPAMHAPPPPQVLEPLPQQECMTPMVEAAPALQMQHDAPDLGPPPRDAAFHMPHLQEPMMYWATPEPQPPPYDGSYSLPSNPQTQPTYNNGLVPPQYFPPNADRFNFDNRTTYYPDMSSSSNVASPNLRLQTTGDALGFYAPTPQSMSVPSPQGQATSGMMTYSPMAYSLAPTQYMNSGPLASDSHQHSRHNYGDMR